MGQDGGREIQVPAHTLKEIQQNTVMGRCKGTRVSSSTQRERRHVHGKDASREPEGTSQLRQTSKENPVSHSKAVWREEAWWALGGTQAV